MQAILEALSPVINRTFPSQASLVAAGRKALQAAGVEPNPVGVGNAKTELPGTYRPVGASCPSTCALLGSGCYAQKGHVALAQNRAKVDLDKDLGAAALAMVAASKLPTPKPARLHVSGDLLKQGELDSAYIAGLQLLAPSIPSKSPVKAYGYTHAKGPEVTEAIQDLKAAGIVIRPSLDDKPEPGGAFVAEKGFRNFQELKLANPDTKLVKCREQVDGTSCANCGICWDAKTASHCVIFAKH